MFFYVDESGQTGLNLFDKNQPILYYGVLSSRLNLDLLAEKELAAMRRELGVPRLHAAELGNGRLIKILDKLLIIEKKFDLRFDLYRVAKVDHAIITFFDQTFDQGLNPAVPWSTYWTPMRYLILMKLAYLFDEPLLKKAWKARLTVNKDKANRLLVEVCGSIVARVGQLPDARSREIIEDGMNWVIRHPSKLEYNIRDKNDSLQISPNLIGFQSVLHGIAARLKKAKTKARGVTVDRQSEFNSAQEYIADLYSTSRGIDFVSGVGLPKMDLKHMPTVPIACTPGNKSAGLELVDIYIWIFKRSLENKALAPELYGLMRTQMQRGRCDEISLNALNNRWSKWFSELPEPNDAQLKEAKIIHETQENLRKPHIVK